MDMLDRTEKIGDLRQKQLEARIARNYSNALEKAISEYKKLFREIEDIDSGKIKPPMNTNFKRWRKERLDDLIHRSGIIERLADELVKRGVEVNASIKDFLRTEFNDNFVAAERVLQQDANGLGISLSFNQLDKRQLDIIMLQNAARPFTAIAFERTVDRKAIQKRLADEMYQATLNGESQKKIIARLAAVTGFEAGRCKRIAQTERTRIQSQARYMAGDDASKSGVVVYNTWSARMRNTREAHMFLDGQRRMQGDDFVVDPAHDIVRRKGMTINGGGYMISYPGDPGAPARGTINCFCVLIPHVLAPGETIEV